MGFDNNDYIDVAQRVNEFFRRYPEASIQCDPAAVQTIGDRAFISVVARAYRTPDDERPGIAQAWEPFPGKTNFTRDSEAMNAETSAIGRALAALGVETKRSMATANDVARRRADQAAGVGVAGEGAPAPAQTPPPKDYAGTRTHGEKVTDAQLRKIGALMRGQSREQALAIVSTVVGRDVESRNDLTKREAMTLIDSLEKQAAAS